MLSLSLSQEFVLCSLTEKGKIPLLETEVQVCILAGALLELLSAGCIHIDNHKKVRISADLPEKLECLQSLYQWLKEQKAMTVEKIAEEYTFTLNGKKLRTLTNDIGDSLVAGSHASFEKGGFGKKHYYIPDPDAVDETIDKIRTQILDRQSVTEQTIILVTLLDKSGQLKRYFSKYDSSQIKIRHKEIKKSFFDRLQDDMLRLADSVTAAVIAATVSSN